LLHSELGVEGMTNRRSLEALIAPAHRWPADRGNPVYEHLGAWWDNSELVGRSFGGPLPDVDLLRRASQHLQYDGLRYAVESRLRHAPRTSGVFPWQLNEPYPNAWCTAAVDYRGEPKPAYYGVRRAYRAAHVCASFPTWAWGGRDAVRADIFAWPAPAQVHARLVDIYGRVVAEATFEGQGGGAAMAERATGQAPLGSLQVPVPAITTPVFVLDLMTQPVGAAPARNRYVMTTTHDLAPLLQLGPAQLEVGAGAEGLTLHHTAGSAALGIVVEDARPVAEAGWAVLGDNMVDLLPGESLVLACHWRGTAGGGRLRLGGWNWGPAVVDLPVGLPPPPDSGDGDGRLPGGPARARGAHDHRYF
jgi:beta-mannosidase